ncbi:hypothetical protein C823_006519 [Eubacterium plexicaudatum ASF492]|nr:hypothetical protein C823_006519 [Eubacterium plexicaudatum ASF492]
MKKEYILFNNKKYNITLSFEDEEFDYYSDVSVILFFEDKSMLLFKDNLLSLKIFLTTTILKHWTAD